MEAAFHCIHVELQTGETTLLAKDIPAQSPDFIGCADLCLFQVAHAAAHVRLPVPDFGNTRLNLFRIINYQNLIRINHRPGDHIAVQLIYK